MQLEGSISYLRLEEPMCKSKRVVIKDEPSSFRGTQARHGENGSIEHGDQSTLVKKKNGYRIVIVWDRNHQPCKLCNANRIRVTICHNT